MEASTTIRGMIQGNTIFVPDYQRAYSWETDLECKKRKQVNVFLEDLEDYLTSLSSNMAAPYYFGHFLYEKIEENRFAIIDGQQRLTTISIFLAAAFNTIKKQRELSDDECDLVEDVLKRRNTYKFSTVQYDNQLFRDYVINEEKTDHYNIETTSANRIVAAYDYFIGKIKKMSTEHLNNLINTVVSASCTTHIVNGEAEAIQMFIFQNNRGKRPSHLEIIKAQFMYNIHIYGGTESKELIEEVKNRFEHIYRSISDIDDFVDEDDVLSYTLQVFANTLWAPNTSEYINNHLEADKRLDFIKEFTLSLDKSFNNISRLLKDRVIDVNVEAALQIGGKDIAIPFFIRAYSNGCPSSTISMLAKSLGDILLRHSLVSTRADLKARLNNAFKSFSGVNIDNIVGTINWLKSTSDYWGGHWNNYNLNIALRDRWDSNDDHRLAKIILWKYENYLISDKGKSGYAPLHYFSIDTPHLEHIAPQTENNEKVAAGYDVYDEEFVEKHLLCLGNFLLLSAPHNESIGNRPFEVKRASYNQLKQQREIQDMTAEDHIWNREKIAKRNEILISFVLENL